MAVFLGPAGDDPLSVEVRRLGVRPGDILVLKLDRPLSEDEFAEFRASVKARMDSAFEDAGYMPKVLVFDAGIEIGVIGPDEAATLCRR